MSVIDYKSLLNSEQLRVVQEGDGPCLVLAGAGTGKTRTIVYRVAYLLEQGVPPENIMLVTFTNKAAREMLRRIEIILGVQPKKLWGGTFHHIGNVLLRRYGGQIGLKNNFTILDEEDSNGLFKRVATELGLAKKGESERAYFPRPALISDWWSFARNSQRDFGELIRERAPQFESSLPKIIQIADLYEARKREGGLVDFDDLLVYWRRLLVESPAVGKKLAGQFKYILVDEYQDTNRLQGAIVEQLAREHRNILVVGDDAQSIYAFRAATVENIMKFPEIFPETKIFRLERNYRSTQEILSLANSCIVYNARQFEKELRSHRGRGQKPELYVCARSAEEARFVTDKIMDFLEEGESLLESAVLFRAAYQALALELELQKRGVPYIIRGGVRFFEQAHIKDIVAYLKILHNPKDEPAWQRILKLEDGIGEKTALTIINTLTNLETQFKIENCKLQIGNLAHVSLDKILKRIAHLQELNKQSKLDAMISYLIDDFYENYARSAFENAKERLEDLKQLALFSKGYENLENFLADATLSEGFRGERPSLSDGRHSVMDDKEYLVLSTIHQAKGLEWKNVFVIGLAEGQFPHYKSWNSRGELEEERRLFYVAITRAKDRLFLTYPISSLASNGGIIHRPSTFVAELDSELFETFEEGERVIEVED